MGGGSHTRPARARPPPGAPKFSEVPPRAHALTVDGAGFHFLSKKLPLLVPYCPKIFKVALPQPIRLLILEIGPVWSDSKDSDSSGESHENANLIFVGVARYSP
jgi:hypothetical protein